MSATESSAETETVTGKTEKSGDLTADKAYHLLQNERRRKVLRYLQGKEEVVYMRDVAEQVAAWENNTTVAELSSDARQRTYIPLYQSHLPKLDKEGIINYDQSRGNIEPTSLVEELNEYLDPSTTKETNEEGNGVPWSRYYLGVSGTGITILAGTLQDISPFATISSTSAGIIVIAMFWILTLGRSLTDRQSV